MHSIVLNRIVAGVALALGSCSALASSSPPKVMREPVFGLRYETAKVKFDLLPAQALANCETLIDNDNSKGVWYVYAQATDLSGRTYYAAHGYEIRNGVAPHLKYDNEGFGVLFFTDRGTCTVLDMPRQVFDDRIFDDEMSQPMLKQLAIDVVRRLIRSFGGADRLRTELRNQHVTGEGLSPELLEAVGPYLAR
jgi:hypothetical protein